MERTFEKRIQNSRLTKTERLIANYFLENKKDLYFLTARDIALALDTSDTSVIRLCRTLGYKGFQDMQAGLRDELSQLLLNERYTAPRAQLPEKYLKFKDSDTHSLFSKYVENIQNTYDKNDPAKYAQAAQLIIQSSHKFVVGFRGFGAAAIHFGVILAQYTSGVQYTNFADSKTIEAMLDMGPDDCVVIFGGERYSKMARVLADMARDAGCRLIVVTDKVTSPLAFHADVVFIADTASLSAMHSFSGVFFISEMIHGHVNKILGLHTTQRLTRLDKYLSEIELF